MLSRSSTSDHAALYRIQESEVLATSWTIAYTNESSGKSIVHLPAKGAPGDLIKLNGTAQDTQQKSRILAMVYWLSNILVPVESIFHPCPFVTARYCRNPPVTAVHAHVPRVCTIPGNAGRYAHAAPFIVNQPAARLAWRLACLGLAADIAFRIEALPHFFGLMLLERQVTISGAPKECVHYVHELALL